MREELRQKLNSLESAVDDILKAIRNERDDLCNEYYSLCKDREQLLSMCNRFKSVDLPEAMQNYLSAKNEFLKSIGGRSGLHGNKLHREIAKRSVDYERYKLRMQTASQKYRDMRKKANEIPYKANAGAAAVKIWEDQFDSIFSHAQQLKSEIDRFVSGTRRIGHNADHAKQKALEMYESIKQKALENHESK